MKFILDQHAHLNSPIHSWDPRFKLISFILLIFTFSFLNQLLLLPVMTLITIIVLFVSKLPVGFILNRLRYPSFFVMVIIILLPFISGDTLLCEIGSISIKEEGAQSALLIAVRFISILTLGLILFGTAPLLTSIKAMRSLGLPSILADMTLLTFRYLFEIGNYLHQMETALRLRGFNARRFSPRGFGTLAWLGGSILVRSYERSDWVYKAMIMRGYGQNNDISQHNFKAGLYDILGLVLFAIISTSLIVLQELILE